MMKIITGFVRREFDSLLVGIIMFGLFYYIMFFCHADLKLHAIGAVSMLEDKRLFSGNFLMYLFVNFLSGFSGNLMACRLALVILLVFSEVAKYVVVRKAFEEIVGNSLSKLFSFSLLFVYIIPLMYFLKWIGYYSHMEDMYLGYFVPNVWHNSTILCMMPFAISCYLLSLKQLNFYDGRRNMLITLILVFGTLVKPSFFFIYSGAYVLVAFTKYQLKKEFFLLLVPILGGIVCVAYEYLSIYLFSSSTAFENSGSRVIIGVRDLFTFGYWKSNLLYYIASFSFPFLFVCVYRKHVLYDLEFWFVLIMLVVSMCIMWFCHETGDRANDGNFWWQIFAAMWFFYYYILKVVVETELVGLVGIMQKSDRMKSMVKKISMRGKCFFALYAVHVFMGLLYVGKYIVTRTFW